MLNSLTLQFWSLTLLPTRCSHYPGLSRAVSQISSPLKFHWVKRFRMGQSTVWNATIFKVGKQSKLIWILWQWGNMKKKKRIAAITVLQYWASIHIWIKAQGNLLISSVPVARKMDIMQIKQQRKRLLLEPKSIEWYLEIVALIEAHCCIFTIKLRAVMV